MKLLVLFFLASSFFSELGYSVQKVRKERIDNADYGSFMLSLSGDVPEYSELESYDDFYGSVSTKLNFGIDFYPISTPYLAMGFGFNFGLLSDDGYPRYQAVSGGPYVKDSDGKIELSIKQYDITGKVLFSPFRSQFISFGAWSGISVLDFSETRVAESSSVSATSDSESSTKVYTNEGSRNLLVTGASVLLDITPLEEWTVYTMIATMGIDKVYLAPYVTTSVDPSDKGANFSSQSMGVMFGFEAAK